MAGAGTDAARSRKAAHSIGLGGVAESRGILRSPPTSAGGDRRRVWMPECKSNYTRAYTALHIHRQHVDCERLVAAQRVVGV